MKTIIIFILSYISIHVFYRPIDYRDSYTGNYNSKEIIRRLNSSNRIVYDTSYYTLVVSKNSIDSMLTIMTREGELIVKLKNNIFRHPAGRHSFGRFSGDSIYVTNIPSQGPTSFRYSGKK